MSDSDSSTGTDSSSNLSTSATEREKLSNMTEKERKSWTLNFFSCCNRNIRHAIIFINCHPNSIWSHAQTVTLNVPFSIFLVLIDLLVTLKRKKGKKESSKLKSKKVKNGKDILEKKLKELNNKGKEKKNEVKGSFLLSEDNSPHV